MSSLLASSYILPRVFAPFRFLLLFVFSIGSSFRNSSLLKLGVFFFVQRAFFSSQNRFSLPLFLYFWIDGIVCPAENKNGGNFGFFHFGFSLGGGKMYRKLFSLVICMQISCTNVLLNRNSCSCHRSIRLKINKNSYLTKTVRSLQQTILTSDRGIVTCMGGSRGDWGVLAPPESRIALFP